MKANMIINLFAAGVAKTPSKVAITAGAVKHRPEAAILRVVRLDAW